jgi:L-lactate dehydrogenase (FMN-dependent) and related alpha-hydroxy acid dehydrogenases
VIGLCAQDGHGDLATADAAARTGVPMIASTLSADPMEDVAARFGDTPGFFQLYTPPTGTWPPAWFPGPKRPASAASWSPWTPGSPAGARATWPPATSPSSAGTAWPTTPATRSSSPCSARTRPGGAVGLFARLFGNPLTWDDLPWLRSLTTLPLLVKGICHPDDARRARDGGVDGIYCSTHGGRQADGGLPALDCLPAVVDAAEACPCCSTPASVPAPT